MRRSFPAIRASRLAVPYMKQRGGGSIVMIASIYGREAGGRMTYNAFKAAEISLSKSMAQQLASANIRVNSVAPGSILFPGGSWHKRQQADPEGIADFVKRELPFGRFGRPEEVGPGRRLPGLVACQLDQRRLHRRRRLPGPIEHLIAPMSPDRQSSNLGIARSPRGLRSTSVPDPIHPCS